MSGVTQMALRNADRGEYHELLVVSSVATVVTVRIGLQISGYPRIAAGSLHIAHLLWGGLLMLAAALVLLTYLSRPMMRLGAVLAGVGFGLFIDELGKFVTADNDYFFRPALSIIYICLALLFLLRRNIRSSRALDDAEVKVNAVLNDSGGTSNRYLAAKRRAAALLDKRWLATCVVLIFLVQALAYLVALVLVVIFEISGAEKESTPVPPQEVPLAIAAAACAVGYSALVVFGAIRLFTSRIAGVIWLSRATLFNLLLVQPFQFYQQQLSALLGLGLNLVAYVVLRLALRRLGGHNPSTAHAEPRERAHS
jgi:hypothetical protein